MFATIERGAHLIGVYVERFAGDLGITQAEAHVLAELQREGPSPITTLHREFGHKRSTLTNIVDRLEQRKLISRKPNPDDRRSQLIHLTATGARVATRLTTALGVLEEEILRSVGVNGVANLEALVDALADAVVPDANTSDARSLRH
jgi:MarR family transcriptional regulator, transcriptional regulator for hemolysin